jgi:hypothetical protein
MKADDYIKILNLTKHPEGGYFREVYRSKESFELTQLESQVKVKRNFSTSIYFLLKGDEVSNFHKIKSDEIWHHYSGSHVRIIMISNDGQITEQIVGSNLTNGEMFQFVVPAGVWFAAEVIDKDSFTLVGCTVSPGFDFHDFELASRDKLVDEYPEHKVIINRFTKA